MTSPSTLIRKAAKSRSPRIAARLRAEAAKLRREAREAKKPGAKFRYTDLDEVKTPRRAAKGLRRTEAKAAELAAKVRSHTNEVTARTLLQASADVSGGWRVVDDEIIASDEIERLRKYAREKVKDGENGSLDSFSIALRGTLVTARVKGVRQTQDVEHEKRKAIYDANRIAVVSGFIATVEAMAKRQGGELNPVVTISGYTVARVIEALRLAGYTENGKNAPRRDMSDHTEASRG